MKLRIIYLISFTSFILFLTWNLENSPGIWYDEGYSLQVAKNLALNGRYGIDSSSGFRLFDPIISTGPTVIIPIAIVFKIFGADIFFARLVIIAYSVFFMAVVYILSSNLFGKKVAVIVVFLELVTPFVSNDISGDFFGLSRMVMGEIPALFFLFTGCLFWFIGIDKNQRIFFILSGIFWGLSFITKQQSLLLIPAIFLIMILNWVWFKKIKFIQFAIPLTISLICFGIWLGIQMFTQYSIFLGPNGISNRSGTQFFIPSLRLILKAIKVLLDSGMLIWGIPGIVYGMYLGKNKSIYSIKLIFLIVIGMVWMAWFILESVGWIRYAFPIFLILNIFSAKLLWDLINGIDFSILKKLKTPINRDLLIIQIRNLCVFLAIVLLIISPLPHKIKDIFLIKNDSPYIFAQYISNNIGKDDIIETSETEIVFLTNNKFHQPEFNIEKLEVLHVQFGEPYPRDAYNFSVYNPKYIINGPFSKYTGLYRSVLEKMNCLLITSIGNYDLYEITTLN